MRLKPDNPNIFWDKNTSYEYSLQLIMEKFIFQLQHRIYKAEKQKNKKHVLDLQELVTKSWSIHVLVRWISYKLIFIQSNHYQKSNLKKKELLTFLLPEYYLTLLILEPQWEARFEQSSLAFRVDFTTYNTISMINRNLKKKKQYILKLELNSENKIKRIIPMKKKILSDKIDINFLKIKTPLNQYYLYISCININYICIKNIFLKYFYEKFSKKYLYVTNFKKLVWLTVEQKNHSVCFHKNLGNFQSTKFLYLNSQLELKRYIDFMTYSENCLFIQNQLKLQEFLRPSFCYCTEVFFKNFVFQNFLINNQNLLMKFKEKKINKIKRKASFTVFNYKHYEIKFSDLFTKNLLWQIFPYINNGKNNINLDFTKTCLLNKNCSLFFYFNKQNFLNSLHKFLANHCLSINKIKVNNQNSIKYLNTSNYRVIFTKFFNYWFANLQKYLCLEEKQNFQKKLATINSNLIFFPSRLIVLLKNRSKFFIFNKKIKQQFHFLYINSLEQNFVIFIFEKNNLLEIQPVSDLDLTSFFNTNFSIFSKSFFSSKLKKKILKKNSKIVNKISIQQNKKIRHEFIFDSFLNNKHLCDKIELFIGQKFNILNKFMELSEYKLIIRKFIKSNKNSFYLNNFKLRHLYSFLTNILLNGLEFDFYNWFNIRYKNNFQKCGCLLRYDNQIILLFPNLECLKDSELFFEKWCNSKNVKLNVKYKKITNSLLNSIENSFLNRDLKLIFFFNHSKRFYKQSKRQNLLKKFSHSKKNKKKIFKQFSKDFYLNNLLILTEFVIETIKPTFLDKNGLFFSEKFNVNLLLNCSDNKLKIKNKEILKLNYYSITNALKTKPFSFVLYRQSFKTKSNNIKNMRGLHFLGFYVCQYQFYSKIDTMNSSKLIYETQIFPAKLAVKYHLELLKKIIRKNRNKTQKILIQRLSSYICIWSYYYNIISTKKIHAYCDFVVFKMLWKWACKRHSNKSKKWIKSKYFHCLNGKNWIFGVYQKYNSSFYCLPNHMDIKLNNIEDFENILSTFTFEIFFWHN